MKILQNSVFTLIFTLGNFGCFARSTCSQEFDGLVKDLQFLAGKTGRVEVFKGESQDGGVTELIAVKGQPHAVQFVEFNVRNRVRRLKPEQIKKMHIDGQDFVLQRYFPSGQWLLVNEALAAAAADNRLNQLGKHRRAPVSEDEFEKLSVENLEFARTAAKKLASAIPQLSPKVGEQVILLSDYPVAQQQQLAKALDSFIPKLNGIFGYEADARVLPGKPIVAAFESRRNLGQFQSQIVGNQDFGTIRAFFQVIDNHVIATAEDDRSPHHMTWQAAWGLSGAFGLYSYSDVELPPWVRIGLQQLCSDLVVPRAADLPHERRMVLDELKSNSLNGILDAQNLPGERQIVCKALMAHLYAQNAGAFGQMIGLLKMGHSTEDALKLSFAMDSAQLASSFGRSLGVKQLQP